MGNNTKGSNGLTRVTYGNDLRNAAQMARVKSLSYYSLAAPSHFVRFSVVKDEKVISTSPRLLSNSNISLARTMKPEVLPLPRTPWEKIQQLLHGDIRPTMLSVREQARLERGPTNPLFAMVRERRELVPDLGIHKTGNFLRPHEGEFLVFANMEEWVKIRRREWKIEDELKNGRRK